MLRQIKESDWKVLRRLSPIALDRLCRQIRQEINEIVADETRNHHQRYRDTFRLILQRDDDIAASFDNLRRSSALFQLGHMLSHGLLTKEEFSRFSQETRDQLAFLYPESLDRFRAATDPPA